MCKGSGIGEHKFAKFDDTSIFCVRCGERRVIAEAQPPQIVYVPTVPYVPQYPSWWHPYPWPGYQVWCDIGGGTTTVGPDSTFILNGGITYDAQS